MRIGIVTILKVNNYGAELQAYATQAILKKLGYEAEVIDYLFYKNSGHKKTKGSKPVLPFSVMARLKEWLYPKVTALKSVGQGKAWQKREERFEQFHSLNTSLSHTYNSIEELYAARMDYDVYLTGSDQVWNPGIYSSLAPYFLTFAPEGCKRIAYAASFGVEHVPEVAVPYYRDCLRAYNAIGVREKSAVALVEQLSGKKAEWVLDPTLLLDRDDWLTVAKPGETTPYQSYILIYELTPCPYIRQLADYYHRLHQWPIIRICKSASREDKDIDNITDAGPAEFLYLFAHARLVITNSFHGTAFSINFQRDFYTVLPLRKKNNSRQRSILELFGLQDRLLVEGAPMPVADKLNIDYASVCEHLVSERNKSIDFLKQSIGHE